MNFNVKVFAFGMLLLLAVSVPAMVPAQDGVQHEIRNYEDRKRFEEAFFEAHRHKALGRYSEALDAFRTALSIHPNSAEVHHQMADIYFQEGNYGIAREFIEKAIKLEKKNPFYFELKARICTRLNLFEEAAGAYLEISRLRPGDPTAYFSAADQYLKAKKPKSALKIYQKMEKRFGVGDELIIKKVNLHVSTGNYSKAIDELKRLVELVPGDTRYQNYLAELYKATKKQNLAIQTYQNILKIDPNDGYANLGMADYYRKKNQLAEMFQCLAIAFASPDLGIEDKLPYVQFLFQFMDQDPAIRKGVYDLADILVKTHPGDEETLSVIALLYADDDRMEEGLKMYKQLLEYNKSNPDAWLRYCTLLQHSGNFEELSRVSREAIELYPNQVDFYLFRSFSANRLKDYPACVEACIGGLALYPDAPDERLHFYQLMADSYHHMGQHEQSDQAFDKALEIDPNSVAILNNYAYYLSERGVRLEEAKAMSAKTLEIQPNSAVFLDTYGWILYKLGDFAGAKTYVGKALDQDPANPDLLLHYGDILHQLGQTEDARNYWRKALDKRPDSPEIKNRLNGTHVF